MTFQVFVRKFTNYLFGFKAFKFIYFCMKKIAQTIAAPDLA